MTVARIVRYTLAGAIGAVIAWAVMEPTALMPDVETPVGYTAIFVIGLVSGLMIGLLLGLAEGMSSASPRDIARCAAGGALFGAAGGILGLTFGNAVYNAMYSAAGGGAGTQRLPSHSTPGIVAFVLLLIGRGFGWALIGGFIGLSQGIAAGSTQKMVNGAVGGLIGGGLGGSVFEILAWMNRGGVTNYPPGMIRFISFSVTGASIGMFIGFIQEVTKKAWLIRLVGRNEGKEYVLFKPVTVLGRDELADIPIFGDPDVAERHAKITAQGPRYYIEDMGSFYGTAVNGAKVTAREPLRDGVTVEIGKTRFLFRDRATARLRIGEPAYDFGPKIPTSQHVCPFCGSARDAQGACACSVGTTASQGAPTQQMSQATQGMGAQPSVGPFGSTDAPQPGAAPGPRLCAMAGPYAGQVFPLKSGQTEIGREAGKDIALPHDNTVSRSHARVVNEGNAWVLYDSGSTNGAYVNGSRIQRHELTNGDVVQIGSTRFRFEA